MSSSSQSLRERRPRVSVQPRLANPLASIYFRCLLHVAVYLPLSIVTNFLRASPSVNLHRNPNGAAGSRRVQTFPQCHCIINDSDNNTFIFILASFSWSSCCGDFCQILMGSFRFWGFSPGFLPQSGKHTYWAD